MCWCLLSSAGFLLWELTEWSNDSKCMAERDTDDTEDSADFRLLCLLNILIHHLYGAMASYVSWSNFRHLHMKRSTKSSALAVSTGISLEASECSFSASLSAGLPELTQKHKGREYFEYKRLSSLGTLRLTWGGHWMIPAGWRIPESYNLIQVTASSNRYSERWATTRPCTTLYLLSQLWCKISSIRWY
jgi:hypothetical protein